MTNVEAKEKTERNFELRFVTSVEQITPFLENLTTSTTDNESSENECEPFDGNDLEVQQIAMMNQLNENDRITVIAVPPAITGLATAAAAILPNIYNEYVNFIDLSILNPIVPARDCQKDQLIESEISEHIKRFDSLCLNRIAYCMFPVPLS